MPRGTLVGFTESCQRGTKNTNNISLTLTYTFEKVHSMMIFLSSFFSSFCTLADSELSFNLSISLYVEPFEK